MGEEKMEQREREPKRLTRRNFLKGVVGLAGLAVLGEGCGPTPEKPVVKSTEPAKPPELIIEKPATAVPVVETKEAPTKVSTREPMKEPTKVLPTEVIKRISRVKITGEDLTKELVIGQGGEITLPTPTPEKGPPETKTSAGDFLGFVSRNWQEQKKIETGDLTKNQVSALKFLLSIGQWGGFDNTAYDVKETFPKIDLSLFRAAMSKLPSGGKSEVVAGASPSGLELDEGAHLTVIGTSEKSKERILVTFDRWSGEDPRQFWAVISPEYLASLLAKNNIPFNAAEGEISFKDEKGTICILEIPIIEENFFQDIVKDGGCLWVDESKNPVVPFPPESLVGKDYTVGKMKDGRIMAKDLNGKIMAEPEFNWIPEQWEWKKTGIVATAESDFVGVSKVSPQELEDYSRKTGMACIPLMLDPQNMNVVENLPFYKGLPDGTGPAPAGREKEEIEQSLLGIDIKPGTVVVAPLGEMSWHLHSTISQDWVAKYGLDKRMLGMKCYSFTFQVHLPSGQVIELDFYPGEVEVLAPESVCNKDGYIFPLHPVSAGTPVFRYLGSPGREVDPRLTMQKVYSIDRPGFIKRKIHHGLMIMGATGLPHRSPDGSEGGGSVLAPRLDIFRNQEGKPVYILPKK